MKAECDNPSGPCACGAWHSVEDRIAALEAENARLKEDRNESHRRLSAADVPERLRQPDATPYVVSERVAVLVGERDTERARSVRLAAALRRYGSHSSPCVFARCVYAVLGKDCECVGYPAKHDRSEGCTCGYDAALADAPTGRWVSDDAVEAIQAAEAKSRNRKSAAEMMHGIVDLFAALRAASLLDGKGEG